MNNNKYLKSPMNYVGGKGKLLPQLLPLFPQNINTFVDLFCGGGNVGINVKANKTIFNDVTTDIINLYEWFQQTPITEILHSVKEQIKTHNLSITNKEAFEKYRTDYNLSKSPLKLFLLLCYCFNNQYRVNGKGEFNSAFGLNRSHFNPSMEKNLCDFVNFIQKNDCLFLNYDFKNICLELYNNDFVYADPPYRISFANYNKIWNLEKDLELMKYLDCLNDNGVKFGMSNVLQHKGETNQELLEWSKKYNVVNMDIHYKNATYNVKENHKLQITQEVYIFNY